MDDERFEFLKGLYPALTANEILFNDAEGREHIAQFRAESAPHLVDKSKLDAIRLISYG